MSLVPALFARGPALLEKPKRLSSVHNECSRPRPRAQCCQAGVGVPAVSIRVEGRAQGSQDRRAGHSPWPRAQICAASHALGLGSRLPGCWLQGPNWYSRSLRGPGGRLGQRRGRDEGGRSDGTQSSAPASRAGPGDRASILGRCHASGTGVIKGLALFSLTSLAQRACYPPSESGGRALGPAPAPCELGALGG